MKREFLEGLGLGKAGIDAVMSEYGRSLESMKSRCEAAEGEAVSLKEQLAVSEAVTAENTALKEELTTLKDRFTAFREGVITELVKEARPSSALAEAELRRRLAESEGGTLRERLTALREAHPDAFAAPESADRPIFTAFAAAGEGEVVLPFRRRHR